MHIVKHEKLVRDRIPDTIRESWKEPITRQLSEEEIIPALDRKLQEEVQEYLESHSVEEMADVLEVLHGIAFHAGITWDEVETARLKKYETRGGFEKRIHLVEVRES